GTQSLARLDFALGWPLDSVLPAWTGHLQIVREPQSVDRVVRLDGEPQQPRLVTQCRQARPHVSTRGTSTLAALVPPPIDLGDQARAGGEFVNAPPDRPLVDGPEDAGPHVPDRADAFLAKRLDHRARHRDEVALPLPLLPWLAHQQVRHGQVGHG